MDRFDKTTLLHCTLVGFLIALFPVVSPARAGAQVPPGEDWQTLTTAHFRVTYPSDLLELAQRAGNRAEVAWEALSATFIEPPEGMVDLVVTDHADRSNGFTRVFPSNRIVIYAPPPVDGFGLTHMDEWLELVITHELVHVFHEDHARNLGGVLRKVFGRVPLAWPFFPGSASPGWIVEGIATYYESELTQAGRVRGSFHEMVVRTAILEGGFERIDQASGDSPVWPGGQRYYIYGSLFLKYLMDKYGPEVMGAFVDAVAGQWVPYRMNAASREAMGVSFSDEWEEWRAHLEDRYGSLRDSLRMMAPITEGEALTEEGFYAWSPEPSPDGSGLAFARADGRSDPQIRFLDDERGTQRKMARTNNLSQFSWTPEGRILFSQNALTDSYRLRSDLFLLDREGEVIQVTEGARLDHPDVSPDGSRAVAVQEGEGTNRLVMVDMSQGTLQPLTAFQDQELWSYPRWSPDGRWIATSRWRAGAFFDVVLLSPQGELLWEITADRSVDNAPAWSPDGKWLIWSSDRSGIPNLYAVSVDEATGEPGSLRQITNLLGGGAYPAVDSEGEWLYFSSYHVNGWRIERIPFRNGDWFDPLPRHSTFLTEVDVARFGEHVESQGEPYSPLHTLGPTFWAPTFREGDNAGGVEVLQPGYGLFTSGEDLVGRHAYSMSGTYSRGAGSFNGQGSYSYGGLENPILGLFVSQQHDAASRPWAGITESGDTVPIYLVERERAVGLTTALIRRRSRNSTSLTFSGAHIWEDRFFLEENLEESDRFRLSTPDVRLAELRATLSFGNARSFSHSISPEDGVSALIRARVRRDLTVDDSLRSRTGSDRSYRDLLGYLAVYKGFRGPGFGNHVLAFRVSGGTATGAGADASHFEVGGASGASFPLQLFDLGGGLLFPVRGFSTASRFGRHAWSASLEYRFPIALVNRGSGLFPLHLDWITGTLFLDAGNAWGPELELHDFYSPSRDALVSAGGEVLVRALPLWFQEMDFRIGLAFPLSEKDPSTRQDDVRGYLRLGISF